MLPGFRFLFITTVMSASVLVFAVGAAALLRATHDNFATFPPRRAPQEQVFVKPQLTAAPPTIALLRAEPEPEAAEATAPHAAEPLTSEAMSVSETLAADNFPEPPAPALVDLETLRREVMGDTAAVVGETTPAQPAAVTEPAPEQTASIALPATDTTAKLAIAQRKKAEAEKLRVRRLEAARRAQAIRVAAQRRRAAAVARARTARQTQTQTPALFNPPIGAN